VKEKALVPKPSFPAFYHLEEGDQLETDALRVSTPGSVAGVTMRVLVFMTMRLCSIDYNLLESDGIHLSRKGKGIFGNREANLVWRSLN